MLMKEEKSFNQNKLFAGSSSRVYSKWTLVKSVYLIMISGEFNFFAEKHYFFMEINFDKGENSKGKNLVKQKKGFKWNRMIWV